jgi:hypothetical protein
MSGPMSPLTGLRSLYWMLFLPRLAPWATLCRPLAGFPIAAGLRLTRMGPCPRLLHGAPTGHGGRVSTLAPMDPPFGKPWLIELACPLFAAEDWQRSGWEGGSLG